MTFKDALGFATNFNTSGYFAATDLIAASSV